MGDSETGILDNVLSNVPQARAKRAQRSGGGGGAGGGRSAANKRAVLTRRQSQLGMSPGGSKQMVMAS